MGLTNEFERDLEDQAVLKRPGRVDLRLFQNTPDAGDGHPGLQRCFRHYLHEGGMEKDLELVGYGIKGTSVDIDNAELQQLSNIGSITINGTQWGYVGGADQPVKQADSPTFGGLTVSGNITITGTVDSVDISVLKTNFDALDYYTQVEVNDLIAATYTNAEIDLFKLNKWVAPDGDISMNTHKITGVVDPTTDQDAATKAYVDEEAEPWYVASDDLVHSNDIERNQTSITYVKVKEIVSYIKGNIKLFWEHKRSADANQGATKVYLNGVEQSTERETTSSYTPETYNITIDVGDLIQIWGYASYDANNRIIWVQNMRIKYVDFINTVLY